MEIAKDACEKLKRKRSSIVGAFVSTHGRSIDDVDKSILEAKTALLELTHDLTERSRRWRQIEMLTGVTIVSNPGLGTLQKIVRYVGGGNRNTGMRGGNTGMSSRMSNMSLDEFNDDDARSIAASSHVSSHMSSVTRSSKLRSGMEMPSAISRRAAFELSRESSKESTSNGESSDDQVHHNHHHHANKNIPLKSRISQTSMSSDISRHSQISSTSSGVQASSSGVSAPSTGVLAPTTTIVESSKILSNSTTSSMPVAATSSLRSGTPPPPASPGSSGAASRLQRAARMIKSLSQDSGETEPVITEHPHHGMTSSISDSALAASNLLLRAAIRPHNQSVLDEV